MAEEEAKNRFGGCQVADSLTVDCQLDLTS
jgi:hypothetical protein